MALYRLNESYNSSSAEVLLEQFESFVLYEDMQVEERSLDSLNKQKKNNKNSLKDMIKKSVLKKLN
jgi:hypothetical protein